MQNTRHVGSQFLQKLYKIGTSINAFVTDKIQQRLFHTLRLWSSYFRKKETIFESE